MEEKYIFEGKTTAEAIQKGLKEINLSKEEVEINVLKNEERRSFFSILEPRVVKIEITKKQLNTKSIGMYEKKKLSEEIFNKAKENIEGFLGVFLEKVSEDKLNYTISRNEYYIIIEIEGNNTNTLIGYRGETLNAIQNVITSVANKNIDEKVRIILDISGYKEKRKKVLEDLADKISKTVIRNRKRVVLDPMPAYERKVIHDRLQTNQYVKTTSIGEEPHRKVVVELKKR